MFLDCPCFEGHGGNTTGNTVLVHVCAVHLCLFLLNCTGGFFLDDKGVPEQPLTCRSRVESGARWAGRGTGHTQDANQRQKDHGKVRPFPLGLEKSRKPQEAL